MPFLAAAAPAIEAVGSAAGGAASIAQAARGQGQNIQQASMQVPQAPEVLPLPQLNAPAPQQADLMSILAQIQGGNR